MDEETKLPTVGFRIGSYVNGITGVGSVENLIHIPESMKIAAKVSIILTANNNQVFLYKYLFNKLTYFCRYLGISRFCTIVF